MLGLRAFIGCAFWFHGLGKVTDLTRFAWEFGIPVGLAASAAWTQVIGAVLLIGGLLTPLAAAGLASTMAVASIELIARGERFVDPAGHSWEAAGLYVIANVVIVLIGPGRLSLDAVLVERMAPARGSPRAAVVER